MKKIRKESHNQGSDFDIDKDIYIPSQSVTPDEYYDDGYSIMSVEEEMRHCQALIVFWIIMIQNHYEDLPPYVWHFERVFVSKSQAIRFAKDLKHDINDVRIMRQINLRAPEEVYRIGENGEVIKIKKGE